MKRIALVGFGYWGPNYARILSQLAGVEFTWICDLDKGLLDSAARDFPQVKLTQKLEDVLRDKKTEGIIIATPTTTHYSLVSAALTSEKHVLVEKPLTTSLIQAQQLFKLADQKRRHLMVGHTYLFHPAVRYLKKITASGDLGNTLFCISQRTNFGPIRSDVNVFWDLAAHDISTILYITGSTAQTVSATGHRYVQRQYEDVGTVSLMLTQDIFVNILVSWLSPIKVRQLTLVGDKQMVTFDDTQIDCPIRIRQKTISHFEKGKYIKFNKFKQIFLNHGKEFIPKISQKEPLQEQVKHFLDVINNQTVPYVTREHVLEVTRILAAIQTSLRSRRMVTLKNRGV